jgi:DivIVA domain-containing protein
MKMAEEPRTFSTVRMREGYDIGELDAYLDRLAAEPTATPGFLAVARARRDRRDRAGRGRPAGSGPVLPG